MPRKPKAEKEFRLEDHLILAQTIATTIGLKNLDEVPQLAEDSEGYEDDGRTKIHYLILKRPGKNKLPELLLKKYDDNIEKHLKKIRKTWGQDLNLKYYQYLAALFAEIYLHHYFRDPKEFTRTLNLWNRSRGSNEGIPRSKIAKKLAYWMATGSGKTLLMHLNLLQFLEYNKGPYRLDYDNIILVTSGDNMSQQHKEDFRRSGIPADLFDGTTRGYFHSSKDKVKIISIHKLKLPGEKTGSGVTVDVSAFGTKNLVFIDEGHKGQKAEDPKWKTVREKLAEDGFIWEYSATFGQTITSKNSPYFEEYKYSILFDYSYKYFHQDGYGKDFHILNLSASKFKEQHVPTLLLANTLDYHEQLQVYLTTPDLRDYRIEKPLWIFLGSKVKTENSDILQVVRFLNEMFKTDRNAIIHQIKKILVDGESGIMGPENRDAFTHYYPEKNFTYLREQIESKLTTPEEIYQGILTQVFQIPRGTASQTLELHNIKNAKGEIGLKANSSDHFFGVINIGDKSGFLKLVREKAPTITIRQEAFQRSLFDTIDNKTSTINLLLGAKKFIEGWNSYRVSNMCLLNIGKTEGPQVIQLFGRGVRLKGKNLSLKRSSYLPGPHPAHLETIETLRIFGIQANYLQTFKEYIDKENIPTYELPIKTTVIDPFPEELYTIIVKEGWSFYNTLFEFKPEKFNEYPKIDLLPRMIDIDSRNREYLGPDNEPKERIINQEILDLLDWNEIYYQILEYKNTRGIHNIHIKKESLKFIIENKKYKLFCNKEDIQPLEFTDLERTREVVVTILKKFIDLYYKRRRLGEEKKAIKLASLFSEDEKILDKYDVKIKTKDRNVVRIVEEQAETIKEQGYQARLLGGYLENAFYSGHLYQPLLSKPKTDDLTIAPTGLNPGETKFVTDLQKYLSKHHLQNKDVYLLRNLTRGKGVGFFEENSFYPDFILWLKDSKKQRIIFIDPKGISRLHLDHKKLTLHKYLKEEINPIIGRPDVELDAYIISVTPFESFCKAASIHKNREQLAIENHLLFMKETQTRYNEKYMDTLFGQLSNVSQNRD